MSKRARLILTPWIFPLTAWSSLLVALTFTHAFVAGAAGALYLCIVVTAIRYRFFLLARGELAWPLALVAFISFLGIAGALGIIAGLFTPLFSIAVLIAIPFIGYKTGCTTGFTSAVPSFRISHLTSFVLAVASILFALVPLVSAYWYRTTDPAVSLWPLLPPMIFWFYGMAIASYIGHAILARTASLLPLFFIIASTVGCATLAFPLGYGFDPFIHHAAELEILRSGGLSPAPYTYSGFYGVVLFLSQIFSASVLTVDKILVPVLTALVLPVFLFGVFRNIFRDRRSAVLAPLIVVLIPLSEYIQSTPQALSFLLCFTAVTLVVSRRSLPHVSPWLSIGIAAAAVAAHPLTGVPIFFSTLIPLIPATEKQFSLPRAFLFGLIGLSTPVLLLAAGGLSTEFSAWLALPQSIPFISDLSWTRYAVIDDATYLLASLSGLLFIILAFVGWRQKLPLKDSLFIAGALFLSALITALFLRFDFATDSEQLTFAGRLLTLARYPLILLAGSGLALFISRSLHRPDRTIIGIALISMLATSVWYTNYPRFDTRVHSKGFTASRFDYEAVKHIHDTAPDTYVVLANQVASAVAVQEYGFRAYYEGMLYYPLPTNGPLYRLFLQTLSTEDVVEALSDVRKATGVRTVYVIVHSYWDQFEAIKKRLSVSANEIASFGNVVYVFTFDE